MRRDPDGLLEAGNAALEMGQWSLILDLLRASMCCVRDEHRARNRGG
jgi:hypothetical protein